MNDINMDDINTIKKQYGEIASILVESGYISLDKIKYAARIQEKLSTTKPIIEVLKELKYITDEQVKTTIRKNRLNMRIGSLFVELGYITEENLQAAFDIQKESKTKRKIGEILIEQNCITEKKLTEVLSLQLGFNCIEPELMEIDLHLFSKAPSKWFETYHFVPIQKEEDGILIAFSDPLDPKDIEGAKEVFGENIIPAIALKDSITNTIHKIQKGAKTRRAIEMDENSIIGLTNTIIIAAVEEGASDIHIEPMIDRLRIRFRKDGILIHHKDHPPEVAHALTSRLKIMCKADIAEKRRHQGGRIFFDHGGTQLDLRASFYATIHGEKIVMRLLNRQGQILELNKIGMYPRMLERFREEALNRPSGVVIITGPTGSGKTSTVYSCISYLNSPQVSIITAEEPVEYIIDGIAQCSINPKINLTFEETLRHIVRQDPDIIVIGEIRDNYSAGVAVQAALTGHKVLTTFHTEDSIGGLIRLLNMDIEAFLISSTVVCVVAQRLLRKVCSNCAQPHRPSPKELQRLGYIPKDIIGGEFRKGRGCSLCRHTGYSGRVGIFELLILDEIVRNSILERKTSHEIRATSIESSNLITLFEDGIVKAANGITTIDEILRTLPCLQKPRSLSTLRRLVGV
jgi:type IV pilus assembly protein PilB